MDIRVLVFNSGTYERAKLSKMTEKELYELYEQDEENGMYQVQCYTLDEFSCAFNDEDVSDQDWLYFIDMENVEGKEYFSVTSVSRADLEGIGFDTSNVDDDTMERLASKLGDDYCEQLYWSSLEIIAGECLGIPKKSEDENQNDNQN